MAKHTSFYFLLAFFCCPLLAAPSSSVSPLAETRLAIPYAKGDHLSADYEPETSGPLVLGLHGVISDEALTTATRTKLQPGLAAGLSLRPGSLFRISQPKAKLKSTSPAMQRSVVLHEVDYHGIPLTPGSDVLAIVGSDSSLLLTRKRQLPSSVDGDKPDVATEAALSEALSDSKQLVKSLALKASAPTLVIWVDNDRLGHLSWETVVSSSDLSHPFAVKYWVSALRRARVLARENQIYTAVSGNVSSPYWATSSLKPPSSIADGDLSVCPGSTGGACVDTDDGGHFVFSTAQPPFSALASLSGPNAVVKNQAGANLLADGSTSGSAPVSVTFSAPAEADLAQTSGFVWTNVMQHFAAGKIGTNVSLARLVVNVNIDETCNANFNQVDISLNFFKSGDNCANTAYSDVIMHEFGHAIDDSNGGILDNAYSEGFGDAMALLVSQQPCVGRDFNGLGTCLRNSSEVVAWPAPAGDDPHDVGRRYSGFVWELVQQLRQSSNPIESAAAWNTAKNLVLGASVMNPSDIPDAVKLSFVADGWVSPTSFCSPHFKELAAAADSRAIPRPTTCTPLNCAAIKLELTSLQKQLSAAEQRRGTSVCAGPASLECEMAVKNIQTQINTENSIFREYCST